MQVVIDSVGHRFPTGPWLFRGLTARLDPGQVYALVGPSGSGKSTLLSLIAGWVAPAEGAIERLGSGRTSWVFQNPHGAPRRTVLDHVVLPLLAAGARRREAEADAAPPTRWRWRR
ncbi:ATP-binding cassette domain-containing protein [Actinomyces sp. B33]|uniref:ATP-binding cassette domain-containing protein n=1 Tax=Actinomyces sp. B33 TaxID=2942131 RepID=UPI0023405269|nr:ATP-binding cassette domain-containing protein [Actinomyces sp. B33]MDC4233776.1 ATP-binding cassette domain-containing protein [Actinomyces sp. B33]